MILVEHILEDARKRLAMLSQEALVPEAARILVNPDTPLIVVCDRQGIAVGVLSKTDIMKALIREGVDAVNVSTGAVMSKSVCSCHVDEPLQRVWTSLNAKSLRCVPVLDDSGRPQGVVHARDLARALLNEVNDEELLLRDYVLGIGYQ